MGCDCCKEKKKVVVKIPEVVNNNDNTNVTIEDLRQSISTLIARGKPPTVIITKPETKII